MDTNALKKFAQGARNLLIDQVTAKLDLVLDEAAPARREHPAAIKALEGAIPTSSQQQVIEQVAYTWFNRFTALRFMDASGLTNPRVVSPADGATRPEILSEAMAGNLPDNATPHITELLQGTRQAHDPQAEAYRLLLIHACHDWHNVMPWLFETLDDYTELLMPDDLLSQTSILARLRDVMTEEACEDVEIIGWLYQFYISEKKDQVFAGLKKNVKITAENIPAATQLFTPHWIVRYLVENSLGRLWLLNRPDSDLASRMEYYIAPEEPETDFLRIERPEDIRICDPAAGSGHMLTYAFDLLYEIYAEEGYEPAAIPELILTHNLTGVEIDDRAGALAAFALAMKAAAKLGRRRFLRMAAKPDICVLQNVSFTPAEMQDVAAVVGKDLFTDELRETLGQFEQAKNFGSLIVPKLRDPAETLRVVEARDFGGDLLLKEVQARVVAVLRMAEALSSKYHVVVANPPYMGVTGANKLLKRFVYEEYSDYKSDLFSAFVSRSTELLVEKGICGQMTPFVWMFISAHSKLRDLLYKENTLLTLVRPSYTAFFQSAIVPICAYIAKRSNSPDFKATYFDLGYLGNATEQPERFKKAKKGHLKDGRFSKTSREIRTIPGAPVAYWVGDKTIAAFRDQPDLKASYEVRSGIMTGNDSEFLRTWHEVALSEIEFGLSHSSQMTRRFFPMSKGGSFRRWFGNQSHVINLWNNAEDIKSSGLNFALRDDRLYFRPFVTWSRITSSNVGFRFNPTGVLFSDAGPGIFAEGDCQRVIALANSKVATHFLNSLNPTLNFQTSDIGRIPLIDVVAEETARSLVSLSRGDWDAYETSWDFTTLPLLSPNHRGETLEDSYATLRTHWQSMTDEMQRLEEENNRIFIDAYGLQDELTPEVPLNEITLTCNPAYRYGVKGTEDDRETRLRADTMAEFLSYAVGCMFGRYSLDAPGLILANQGETLQDYLARVPEPQFMPDEDNVIPVLDGDWFPDDITERFRTFLRVTFGDDKFRENLSFIEDALGKDIRKYFTKDFYTDHVKRYKKRPIYWMFSSPKGSFNALVYLHRYRPDTVSVVLNEYLREFITKLTAERASLEKLADDPTATQSQRTKAMKAVGAVIKQIDELTDWERDVVFPMAQAKIDIDLDDGVKANYPKFAGAVKKIVGL
ncbi:BREX-1 system adenine-specific DNA-methyltransferase PglX [Lentibacter sp. XHP0401]|uniref:BREX-1 system adenine-specific DNA-methyltransferase PglX n=1 Tax=Lentibacter sp. XHP0401 TaxID=2984334 RepID=UPI0021E771EC|nr:BREX-1 system adenine-specific DNA-methyltransferase PglX [Lentibacter sp. XHP0401]MCV2894504.1 BREX-1 system adenine-specific DNA-methyltransferase PglX [Lentibacter sp. XHP0401]